MGLLTEVVDRLRYKISHLSKFPKGNLVATFRNLAKRGFEPTHIVDVGANKGRWSRDARKVYPDAAFTLIEPQREMARYLDKFCEGYDNCRWIEAGAGDKSGELTFTVCPDTVSSSFAVTEEDAKAAGFERRTVPVITLDELLGEYMESTGKSPEIVKIDAEGFEFQVLQGAKKLLGKSELIFLEAHMISHEGDTSGFVELTKQMCDLGYAPYDFTWFGKRPADNAVMLCEVAFARKDGILRAQKGWHATPSKAA